MSFKNLIIFFANNFSKLITLFLFLILILVSALTAQNITAQQADQRPDIIVVMVDDLGYIPNDRILKRMPNIKRIFIDGGIRFTQMYNETPLCCPARANFLSGKHTLSHKVLDNNNEFFNDSETITNALSTIGYHNILVGKYLNKNKFTTTMPPGWNQFILTQSTTIPSYWVNGVLTDFEGRFFDDVVREQSVSWLQKSPLDKPVFLLAAPRTPHRHRIECEKDQIACIYLPKVMDQDKGAKECSDIANFKPPNYEILPNRREYPVNMVNWPDGWRMTRICESLLVVDRMVGQLFETQKSRGRPAYFIFMSDNGMSWGQKSYPLKHVPTSTRLPFYLNGPGILRGSNDNLLSIIDIPVTIAEITGARIPWADGKSFLSLLNGGSYSGNSEILEIMAVPPYEPTETYLGWAAIRTPKWRYIKWDSGKKELYNLDDDPWELNNLVNKRPNKAKEMKQRLQQLIEESRN